MTTFESAWAARPRILLLNVLGRTGRIVTFSAGLVLGGAGCHSSAADSKADPSATTQQKGGDQPQARRPEKPNRANKPDASRPTRRGAVAKGGPETLFSAALDNLELSEVQKTAIESARAGVREQKRSDKPQAFAIMAKSVRAGKIDEKALQTEIDGASTPLQEGRARMLAGLEKLHATLTPEQRKVLVALMIKKLDENAAQADDRDPARGARLRSPIDMMLKGVTMTDELRAKVDKALTKTRMNEPDEKDKPSKEAFLAKRKAALEAFANDKFDGEAVLPPENDKGVDAQGPRMIKALAIVVPMLDESQRGELAERLEQGPRGDKQNKRGSNIR